MVSRSPVLTQDAPTFAYCGIEVAGYVGVTFVIIVRQEDSGNPTVKDQFIYPVIDLFAGPGGLGEGFASLRHPKGSGHYAFRTAISIEKDPSAHRTLQLRHFFRTFASDTIPDDYYRYLEGTISLEELYSRHPESAWHAEHTAWLCELGNEPHENVRYRIAEALDGNSKWVLVGGPPCQAYSRAGRSRMRGNPDFEDDPRHFLYKEYLRILIDHMPPVFVMENVKGLISSKIQGRYVINDILRDLSKPASTVGDEQSGLEYRLYSLSQSGVMSLDADPSAFVVKAEEYGIPQSRHRIFILGIRSDVEIEPRILGRVCKLKPQQDHGDGNHGGVIDRALFIAGGNATTLLETVEKALNPVAFAIDRLVKGSPPPFIAFAREGDANAAPP